MTRRCKLCQRRLTDTTTRTACECGWVMDRPCAEDHDAWCASHGEDRWIGAQEY